MVETHLHKRTGLAGNAEPRLVNAHGNQRIALRIAENGLGFSQIFSVLVAKLGPPLDVGVR